MLLATTLAIRAATISGRVVDPSGEVLPGVSVETQNRTTITDRNGTFAIDVGPGAYDVTFRLINFTTVMKRGVVAPSTRRASPASRPA